jgi:8-oxo-dGTP diphosphatase
MKTVAAAICVKKGKVLVARRSENQSLAGHWEFPGGKLEGNETILECIEREILEELGVNCHAIKVFAESHYQYDNGSIKLVGVLIDLENTVFELTVHDSIEWVGLDLLLEYKLAPADIEIAKEIVNEFR